MQQISLGEIARHVDGELSGAPDKLLTGVALIDDATSDQLTFSDDPPTLRALDAPHAFAAGAVIVPRDYDGGRPNVIKVENPQLACARAILLFHPEVRLPATTSPRADIHETATIGRDVHVGAFVSIGRRAVIGDRVSIHAGACVGDDVVIGDDTTLGPRVIVLAGSRIGRHVIVHAGSVIGADGFGYVVVPGAPPLRIPHVGHVVIEDHVEIGAGNTIERANLGRTLIRQGAKTGALVHIGHNVTVGRDTRIVAQAGIGGNTIVGERVLIGGQAGVEQNLTIGDDAVIGPQAGVICDVAAGEQVFGTPGMSRGAWLRSAILIPQLARMRKELTRLSKQWDELLARLGMR